MSDFQETVFYLIAQRTLKADELSAPISFTTLLQEASLYCEYFIKPADLSQAISQLRKDGFIKVRQPDAGDALTRRAFSTLLFEITPVGLEYIDRLNPEQRKEETLWTQDL